MVKPKFIEVTKTSYNIIKIWGVFNLILGFIALYVGYEKEVFTSLVFAAIGIVSGGIMITISKGDFVIKKTIKLPIQS